MVFGEAMAEAREELEELKGQIWEAIQHAREVQEHDKALEKQKMLEEQKRKQAELRKQWQQESELAKKILLEKWLEYLNVQKGITVGFVGAARKGASVEKNGGRYCVPLKGGTDGVWLKGQLNRLCATDWKNFLTYLKQEEDNVHWKIEAAKVYYRNLEYEIQQKEDEIRDLTMEYSMAVDFSIQSLKKRMINEREKEIKNKRLQLSGLVLEMEMVQQSLGELWKCKKYCGKTMIPHVEYERIINIPMLIFVI